MDTTHSEGVAVGERLPAVALATAGSESLDLRRTRHESSVLVFVHRDCGDCQAYVAGLEALAQRLHAWGGRVLVVAADWDHARSLAGEVSSTIVCDEGAHARAGAGLGSADAAVVVSDKFGTVYRCVAAGAGHELVAPDELLEEVRYMGSQCPECGVPDDPLSGEEAWHRAGA